MFVRKKRNLSGTTSVQVVDKSKGYRVVKTMGASKDPVEIQRLLELGRLFTDEQDGQYLLPFGNHRDQAVIDRFVSQLQNTSIRTIGPELIFGRLFDELGFDAIPEGLFRDMVVARLVYPTSKLKTIDYLYRYRGQTVSVQQIYRFLDRLHGRYEDQVQQIAYGHTRRILQQIRVVFYDMTTLYFEAEDEDDLRRIGFSKDGKFQCPQIMLGLLVGESGYPIGYDIFEGNRFEGKTLLPVLRRIQERYQLGKPVVVADAGMLSKGNLATLKKEGYPFIVAARLRNEPAAMQEQILKRRKALQSGQAVVMDHGDGRRLVVSYSDRRAKRDQHNRERGLSRLRKQIGQGRLTKEQFNRRGYNKFLKLKGEVALEIDEDKVSEDAAWDGLKGYLTNTNLSAEQIIDSYGQLWHIEKAFRISKTDLRIRPIYHRRQHRIEAHILIAFVAYAIYKELERRLEAAHIPMTPKRAAELTQTMYELTFTYPQQLAVQTALLKMCPEQQQLYDLICPHK